MINKGKNLFKVGNASESQFPLIFKGSLKRLFRTLLGIQFFLCIGLVVLTTLMYINQSEFIKSQRIHFQSYLLADELRQSSDDLTRLARSYVASDNEEFERQYHAVLDIRNGKKPRPVDYNRIYWDFVTKMDQKPRPDGEAISLRELMIKTGFTNTELEMLTKAQKYSDSLVKTEEIAMNANKGLYDDGTGNFTVRKEPNHDFAIRILYDDAYHKKKVQIMKPIDEVFAMISERTDRDVAKFEKRSMSLVKFIEGIIIIFILLFVFSFFKIMHQITDRDRVLCALVESEEKYRKLIELSHDAILIHVGGIIQFVNNASLKLFEASSKDEFIGRKIIDLVHPDYVNIVEQRIAKIVNENIEAPTIEEKLVTLKGVPFYAEVTAIPVNLKGKQVIQVVARDITERKLSNAILHEKEVQYKNLANAGMALIWTSGTDKLCNYFNEPWLKFTGRTIEQEIGNGWAENLHPDDFDHYFKIYIISFDKREAFDLEHRLHHVSGEYRWIRDLGTPNYNSNGEFIGYIGYCFDITQNRQAEEALRKKTNELELLNGHFLGRELKMIELKKEINELLKKLGGMEKYVIHS
ncbi:MAG: PAS domain S-box protein [Bacteroidales bacterium]|nr:PAS domain S-box protein [Bacteroidales bacterium]